MTIEIQNRPSDTPAASLQATTMRAIVQNTYGEAGDVLHLETISRPEIGDGEVLVRVRAAGVDKGIWHLMTGLPYPVRLAGGGVRAPKTPVRGGDLAGWVEAVGSAVTTLQVGDEVFGIGRGALAEYACGREDKLALKPKNLTYDQAATVPVSGLTALQAVRDRGGVRPGHKVLIIGASGGVGSFAVQIAKAYGAEVTGVCSTAKVDMVRSIGADHVIDYTQNDIGDDGQRYDVILDIAGNRSIRQLRRALAPRGTLVIVGGETGGRWTGGAGRQLRALMLSPFVNQKLGTFMCSENASDLRVLTALIESGQVTPVMERTYPLNEAATAIGSMQAGEIRGKVAISIGEEPEPMCA